MSILSTPSYTELDAPCVVHTGAADDASLALGASDEKGWERVYDQLLAWSSDPRAVEDDNVIAPSRRAIHAALKLAPLLQAQHMPPPERTVPTGTGGVAIECREGPETLIFEIDDDGATELKTFRNGRLALRKMIPVSED